MGKTPEPISILEIRERTETDTSKVYYGWQKTGEQQFSMIYPKMSLLGMCFPYGIKAEVEAGHGRVVQLHIEKVDTTNE
jgi:hypothetical protein